MSVVINRSTKQVIESADTPDYDPIDWVIFRRADAAKIAHLKVIRQTTPDKYLTFDEFNTPSAMGQGDRDAIDAQEAQLKQDVIDAAKAAEDVKVADPTAIAAIADKAASEISTADLWVVVKSLLAKK